MPLRKNLLGANLWWLPINISKYFFILLNSFQSSILQIQLKIWLKLIQQNEMKSSNMMTSDVDENVFLIYFCKNAIVTCDIHTSWWIVSSSGGSCISAIFVGATGSEWTKWGKPRLENLRANAHRTSWNARLTRATAYVSLILLRAWCYCENYKHNWYLIYSAKKWGQFIYLFFRQFWT